MSETATEDANTLQHRDIDYRSPISFGATNLARLETIMADEDYDEEFLKPTEATYRFTRDLLTSVDALAATMGPLRDGGLCVEWNCSPAPVGDGGIFVQWGPADRYVRLLVPRDPSRAYLYSRSPSERHTDPATREALQSRLSWLYGVR